VGLRYESESQCVAQARFEPVILLTQFPKCWDSRHIPPGRAEGLYILSISLISYPLAEVTPVLGQQRQHAQGQHTQGQVYLHPPDFFLSPEAALVGQDLTREKP
jgi:hypothetical protein